MDEYTRQRSTCSKRWSCKIRLTSLLSPSPVSHGFGSRMFIKASRIDLKIGDESNLRESIWRDIGINSGPDSTRQAWEKKAHIDPWKTLSMKRFSLFLSIPSVVYATRTYGYRQGGIAMPCCTWYEAPLRRCCLFRWWCLPDTCMSNNWISASQWEHSAFGRCGGR